MEIIRNSLETERGPSERFTGDVYVDAIAAPSGDFRVSAALVHFAPGARTAWHSHPNGQTIFIVEGIGCCQRRGGAVETLQPGDRVLFAPGEEHWHGAAPHRFMAHVAVQQPDAQGVTASWGEHVTDEQYGQGRT